MKEQENSFEERLRKHLPPQEEKYALPENYFSNFKERLLEKIDEEVPLKQKPKNYKLNWWLLPASMAACLALFALVKPDNSIELVNDRPNFVGGLEVVIFDEPKSPLASLDSSTLESISDLEFIRTIQEEVALDTYYNDESEEEYIATLEDMKSEDLEDYLIDNLNLNIEL